MINKKNVLFGLMIGLVIGLGVTAVADYYGTDKGGSFYSIDFSFPNEYLNYMKGLSGVRNITNDTWNTYVQVNVSATLPQQQAITYKTDAIKENIRTNRIRVASGMNNISVICMFDLNSTLPTGLYLNTSAAKGFNFVRNDTRCYY